MRAISAVAVGIVLFVVGCASSPEDEKTEDPTKKDEASEQDHGQGGEEPVASSSEAYTATTCPWYRYCSHGASGYGFYTYVFVCSGRAPYYVRTDQGCRVY